MRGAAPLLFAAALMNGAEAADAAGNYAIWGAGSRSCNQYQGSLADPSLRQPFKDFLMGYLTAYNTVAEDTYNALGGATLQQALHWLDEYCDSHKLDSFDRAIAQLVISKYETRARAAGAPRASWGRPAPAAAVAPDGRSLPQ